MVISLNSGIEISRSPSEVKKIVRPSLIHRPEGRQLPYSHNIYPHIVHGLRKLFTVAQRSYNSASEH
jgi:hypothetical protein